MSLISRYKAGEYEAVWAELTALGEAVRDPQWLTDAREVAAETMRRVRHNLLVLQERLPACGYRFNAPNLEPPQPVYRDANPDDVQLLHQLQRENGLLPLSLEAFYTLIGEVDFSQDYDQLVQWPEREAGEPYTELEMLGEFNPLHIPALSSLLAHRFPEDGRVSLSFMPDEAGNAFYSGDYYYTWLPYPHADATIGIVFPGHESFVAYLRQAFQHSGFHGIPLFGQAKAHYQFPSLPCITALAEELFSI